MANSPAMSAQRQPIAPKGPGSPFRLLFSDEVASAPSLPEAWRALYEGDWHLPSRSDRPYVFTNFAQARDGRVSFNAPGISAGGHVTGFNPHDRWLMGLLRARADCVMMGDATLKVESDHLWTAEFICPYDAEAFADLRQREGRAPKPLLVFLSLDGDLGYDQACFDCDDQQVIIATTQRGAQAARQARCKCPLEVLELGESLVDLARLVQVLYDQYAVRHLLCEGGPRVFANMLAAGLVDEEFVTLCPTFVGRSNDAFRPSYTEGVAWLPSNAPQSKPYTLHRAGDFLFLRTQVEHRA